MNNENLLFKLLIMTQRAVLAETTLRIIQALLKSDQYVSTERIAVIINAAYEYEVDAE